MTDDQNVVLSFADRTLRRCPAAEAEKICSDDSVRGYIMDALTADLELRTYLRKLIEKD